MDNKKDFDLNLANKNFFNKLMASLCSFQFNDIRV